MIALGLLAGARFPGGVTGLAVLMACSALLGASLGALSNGLALLAALCATCTWLATRAFRSYQQSIWGPCVRGSSGGGAATPAGVGGRAPGGR